jgi:tetratricopeptide (TPR) repeat protein
MMTALHSAYKTQPNRREALALLGAMHLDLGDLEKAEAYLRSMMALPRPAEKVWTHRDGLYGWAGESLWTQFLRMIGDTDKADEIERARIKQHKVNISIVHATRGRPEQAARVRKAWLDAAADPERIEYIFAFSEDDEETRGTLHRFRHALSPAGHLDQVGGTLVQNCNAGTRASTGHIILTVQDDLHCPLHWDKQIEEALADKLNQPAALQIRDGYRTDDLLITFCVTRPTLKLFGFDGGMVCPEYRGVFCDNDYTRLVQKHGILVPSDITLRHEHPAWNPAVPMDATYAVENSDEGYRFGNEVYNRRWPAADTTPSA